MNIIAVKTRLIHAGEHTIENILAESIPALEDNSIVAISSKCVALCQNRVVSKKAATKDKLAEQEADYYLPREFSKHGYKFSIIHSTIVGSAGIDESNADGHFVLWPKNPQETANRLRKFLCSQFNRKNIGVIITDSSRMPLHVGAMGVMIAYSGFTAVKHLKGTKDLFDFTFKASSVAIGSSLAAAANVVMGEATEQTPIALISDIPFVDFTGRDPTPTELEQVYISLQQDIYAPFIQSAPWQKGGGKTNSLS